MNKMCTNVFFRSQLEQRTHAKKKEKKKKEPNNNKQNKKIPWSTVIYSHMGLKGSEYHASISVSQSTLTNTPHTHINWSAHAHTPWTTKADIRQRRLQQDYSYGHSRNI